MTTTVERTACPICTTPSRKFYHKGTGQVGGKRRYRHKCPHGNWCPRGNPLTAITNHNMNCAECRAEKMEGR